MARRSFTRATTAFNVEEKERRYEEKLKQYREGAGQVLSSSKRRADKLHLWAFMGNDKLHKLGSFPSKKRWSASAPPKAHQGAAA